MYKFVVCWTDTKALNAFQNNKSSPFIEKKNDDFWQNVTAYFLIKKKWEKL